MSHIPERERRNRTVWKFNYQWHYFGLWLFLFRSVQIMIFFLSQFGLWETLLRNFKSLCFISILKIFFSYILHFINQILKRLQTKLILRNLFISAQAPWIQHSTFLSQCWWVWCGQALSGWIFVPSTEVHWWASTFGTNSRGQWKQRQSRHSLQDGLWTRRWTKGSNY